MRKRDPIPMLCIKAFEYNKFPFIKWRTYTIIKSGDGSVLFAPYRPGWRECEMKIEDLSTYFDAGHFRLIQGSFQ